MTFIKVNIWKAINSYAKRIGKYAGDLSECELREALETAHYETEEE